MLLGPRPAQNDRCPGLGGMSVWGGVGVVGGVGADAWQVNDLAATTTVRLSLVHCSVAQCGQSLMSSLECVAGGGHAAVWAGRVGGQGGENGEHSVDTAVRQSYIPSC